MADLAIRVENLSKQYEIGAAQSRYNTLRDQLTEGARRLLRRADRAPENNTIWALRDVSFDVKRGEVLGIIGRNGAGKSTLLKILSRITEPTSGRALVYGRVGSLLEVGTGFHPELTGRENITLNGAILGMSKAEIDRKFDEIVDFAGIEKFIDTPVKRYSSGMYVRLAFAVAAHLEPEILLVDEVLAVGDVQFQRKCLGKMGEVAHGGRTVLFVSHNMQAVGALCQRVIHLSQGALVAAGSPEHVVTDYLALDSTTSELDLHDWTFDRMGEGPMRVTYIATRNREGQPASIFTYGEPLYFHLRIRGRSGQTCIVSVSIRDAMGQMALHLSNTDDSAEIKLVGEETDVTVCLPSNILNDGTYYVTVWLGDQISVLHDRVGNVLSFEVRSLDAGYIRSRAPIRVPVQWSVGLD